MAEARLISFTYLFLRATTAVGALFAGIIQTFVFARILTPERFSIFIIVGSFAVVMPLFDLGLVKLLFVRLRANHLAGKHDEAFALYRWFLPLLRMDTVPKFVQLINDFEEILGAPRNAVECRHEHNGKPFPPRISR